MEPSFESHLRCTRKMHPSSGKLRICDIRTSREYLVEIKDNAIFAADLSKIVNESGDSLEIYDPGLQNTAALRSEISFCGHDKNGGQDKLEFRGYSFDQLRCAYNFEDVTHLMLWGSAPDLQRKQWFRDQLVLASMDISPSVISTIQRLSPEAPYLPMLLAGLSAYLASQGQTIPAINGQNLYHGKPDALDNGCVRAITAYNIILAAVYCHKNGRPFEIKIDKDATMIENLLKMMGIIQKSTKNQVNTLLYVMDQIWITAVDHEMCNSTAALLNAASTLNDPISCFISAITSGYGILHLGGMDNCYRMLKNIGKPANVSGMLMAMIQKRERIPGVGHRVYKTGDPRIKLIKEMLKHLVDRGMKDPLIDVALEIEHQISHHEELRKRKLHVNPDLYLPLIYTSLGIEAEAVMPIFLANRIVGMMAHWRESMLQPIKLWRPRTIFTGKRADEQPIAVPPIDTSSAKNRNHEDHKRPETRMHLSSKL